MNRCHFGCVYGVDDQIKGYHLLDIEDVKRYTRENYSYRPFDYCPDCGNENNFDELTEKPEGDA